MDVKLSIPALEKLLEVTCSGVGAVAGTMLAPWTARQESKAQQIAAKGYAESLQIRIEAQSRARESLTSTDMTISGELDIENTVKQRILFQEHKRHLNIGAVVNKAAVQLGDELVADSEPDHDWTARFFTEVQDVTSEDLQSLWAKVLAGEVRKAKSTSIQTLSILRNLDQETAHLFTNFCSACVFLTPGGGFMLDARVPSLGGDAAHNSLQTYGFNYGQLNVLNEHGLIISDYNSWFNYQLCINLPIPVTAPIRIPFMFQNHLWVLIPTNQRTPSKEFKVSGVALTRAGQELSKIVELQPMNEFEKALKEFFRESNLQMTKM